MMSQVFHIQELHTCNCTFFKKKSCSMMSQVFHIQELHLNAILFEIGMYAGSQRS